MMQMHVTRSQATLRRLREEVHQSLAEEIEVLLSGPDGGLSPGAVVRSLFPVDLAQEPDVAVPYETGADASRILVRRLAGWDARHLGTLLATGQVLTQRFTRETDARFIVASDVSASMLYRFPAFDPEWCPDGDLPAILGELRGTKAHVLRLAACLLLAGASTSGFRTTLVPFGSRVFEPVPVRRGRRPAELVMDALDEHFHAICDTRTELVPTADQDVVCELLGRRRSVVVLLSDFWHGLGANGEGHREPLGPLLIDLAGRHELLVGVLHDDWECGGLPDPGALWLGWTNEHGRDLETEGRGWREITRSEVRDFNRRRAELSRGVRAFLANRAIPHVVLDVRRPDVVRDALEGPIGAAGSIRGWTP